MSTAFIIQDQMADFTAAFATAGVTPTHIQDYDLIPQQQPNNGAQILQAFYDFSDGSGNTVTDVYSGQNATANNVTWDSTKKAIVLAGTTGSHVLVPIPKSLNYEVILLFKSTEPSSFNNQEVILGSYNFNSVANGESLIVYPPGLSNNGQLGIFSSQGGVATNQASGATINNVWRIVSTSLSTVSGTTTAFLMIDDGTTVTSSGQAAAVPYPGNFCIGENIGNGFGPFAGEVAAAVFYNTQLTTAQRALVFSYIQNTLAPSKNITIGAA
jgi:hypothetical protein